MTQQNLSTQLQSNEEERHPLKVIIQTEGEPPQEMVLKNAVVMGITADESTATYTMAGYVSNLDRLNLINVTKHVRLELARLLGLDDDIKTLQPEEVK